MSMLRDQKGLLYYIGLGIYTFENLLVKGQAIVDILGQVQALFPGLPLGVYKAVTVEEQKRQDAVDAQQVSWPDLSRRLLSGEIARFQAQDVEKSLEASIVIWARLNAAAALTDHPNHFILRLPVQAFVDHPQEASANLLVLGKQVFAQLGACYGYAGIRITGTSSEVINRAINDSIGAMPVGDFYDLNIETAFCDQVKGAFWANLLNGHHVQLLGGSEFVDAQAPCYLVEELANGGRLLVLSPNPIPDDEDAVKKAYAQLREFLAPITVAKKPSIPPAFAKGGPVLRKSYNT